MSVTLTGSSGLMTRVGEIQSIINSINNFRSDTGTLPVKINTLANMYTGADLSMINGLFGSKKSWQNVDNGIITQLQNIAKNTVITMVGNDQVQPSNTIDNAINVIVQQMLNTAQTVTACVVTSTVTTVGTNFGNVAWTLGLKAKNGKTLENSFSEVIAAKCTTDSQNDSATRGQETFNIQAEQTQANPLFWDYPKGSGTNTNYVLLDPASASNLAANSSFDSWQGTTIPTSWTSTVGAGISKELTITYDGTAAVKIAGDGSSLTGLYTPLTLGGIQQYCCTAFIRASHTSAMTGTLQVSLVDGNQALINDYSNVPNAFFTTLSSVSTNWLPISGMFRTPQGLPPVVNLKLKLTTPITTGYSLYIDRLTFGAPQQMYQGGPYISGCAYAGGSTVVKGDTFNMNISNNYVGKAQRSFEELFNLRSLQQLLPSSNLPTINDAPLFT